MKVFLLVSALLLLSALAVKGTPAYDLSGKQLKPHTAYYIIPFSGTGGGLNPDMCDPPCTPYVTQTDDYDDQGSPVAFNPVDRWSEDVQLLTDMSIQFLLPGANFTEWKLKDADKQNVRHYVTLDDDDEFPDANFKIVKSDLLFYYKLMYCPSDLKEDSSICGDLGIYHENGKSLLGLTSDTPLQVVFVEKDEYGLARPLHDSV